MANGIKIFENPEFGSLRTVEIDGVIYFHAADACKVLGFNNPTDAIKRIPETDKARLNLGLPGGAHNFVNESGLYALILGSRKPEAEKFKHWVTSDVLPSIRKHGAYMTETTIDKIIADPDFGIRLLQQLKTEKEKAAVLQQENLRLEETNKALVVKVKADEPMVLFAESVEASVQSILVGDLAKLLRQNGYDIGPNRLFEDLRSRGYLMSSGSSWNMPTQYSMERGWFEVKERTIIDPNGSVRLVRTTKVTGKGQIYFINLYLKKERNDEIED